MLGLDGLFCGASWWRGFPLHWQLSFCELDFKNLDSWSAYAVLKLLAPTRDEVSHVNYCHNDTHLERWIKKDFEHTLANSLLRTGKNVSVFELSDLVLDFWILMDS